MSPEDGSSRYGRYDFHIGLAAVGVGVFYHGAELVVVLHGRKGGGQGVEGEEPFLPEHLAEGVRPVVPVAACLDAQGIHALTELVQPVEDGGELRIVHGQGEVLHTHNPGAGDHNPDVGVLLELLQDGVPVLRLPGLDGFLGLTVGEDLFGRLHEFIHGAVAVGEEPAFQPGECSLLGLPEQVGAGVGVGQRTFRGQQGEQMGFLRAAGVELYLKLTFLVILEGNAVGVFAHPNGIQFHLQVHGSHGQLRHQGVLAVIDHGSDHNDNLLRMCQISLVIFVQ